jgi:hypothetical protein
MERKLIKKDNQYYCFDEKTVIIGTTDEALLKHESLSTKKLSFKNCEAIERGYDLYRLVESKYPNVYNEEFEYDSEHDMIRDDYRSRGFLEGAKAILEIIGDKKFSVDDMKKAFEKGAFFGTTKLGNNHYFDELIESLNKNEWDVEIETEIVPDLDSRNEIDGQIFSANKKEVPKIDRYGCLILKRI